MSTESWALVIAIISLFVSSFVSSIAMWKAQQTGATKQRLEAVDHLDDVLSYPQKARSVSVPDGLRNIREAKKRADMVFSKALQSRLNDALRRAERLTPLGGLTHMPSSHLEAVTVFERDLQGIIDQMKDEGAVSVVHAAQIRCWRAWRWMRSTG